ncbi:arabinose-5-phosphate isomerase KdsD [Candidatus Fukatsuia anoeciicola]|uniref:arabinose-5-phosphate isomerase KdsD n=1 Tax=Candidatus Fukatsuia anoeciicola TaxID=2994492 RepID=UPI003463BD4D
MSNIELLRTIHFQQSGKRVLEVELNALAQLNQYINEDFSRACEKILHCRGKIIVMGVGKSGHIGRKIAATLASTGTPAFFVHPTEAGHGDLGIISSEDIVLAISNSGESDEMLPLIPMIKYQNILLICMSSNPDSRIGKVADIHLCIKVAEEACPMGLAPTTSTTATLIIGDALSIALLEARDFTREDFARSHPKGTIGRKLSLRVSDIMHTGNQIPYIRSDALLRDALLEIIHKKLSLIVICDNSMTIEGVFTDEDLRRVFDMKINLNNAKIADVMTQGGIRVGANILVVDAFNLMQARSVTSLLVAKDNTLLGIIHIHDILKAGVI